MWLRGREIDIDTESGANEGFNFLRNYLSHVVDRDLNVTLKWNNFMYVEMRRSSESLRSDYV